MEGKKKREERAWDPTTGKNITQQAENKKFASFKVNFMRLRGGKNTRGTRESAGKASTIFPHRVNLIKFIIFSLEKAQKENFSFLTTQKLPTWDPFGTVPSSFDCKLPLAMFMRNNFPLTVSGKWLLKSFSAALCWAAIWGLQSVAVGSEVIRWTKANEH